MLPIGEKKKREFAIFKAFNICNTPFQIKVKYGFLNKIFSTSNVLVLSTIIGFLKVHKRISHYLARPWNSEKVLRKFRKFMFYKIDVLEVLKSTFNKLEGLPTFMFSKPDLYKKGINNKKCNSKNRKLKIKNWPKNKMSNFLIKEIVKTKKKEDFIEKSCPKKINMIIICKEL